MFAVNFCFQMAAPEAVRFEEICVTSKLVGGQGCFSYIVVELVVELIKINL